MEEGFGWSVEMWDGGKGLRISQAAAGGDPEYGLVMTKETAEDETGGLLEHMCLPCDAEAVDMAKQEPSTTVYLYGGLISLAKLRAFLQAALRMVDTVQGSGAE